MTTRALTIWNGLDTAYQRSVSVAAEMTPPQIRIETLRQDQSRFDRPRGGDHVYRMAKVVPPGLLVDIKV